MRENVLVTLTGPSCSGKSTLEAQLRAVGFVSLISTTTRPMRAGEVDGQHYYFVSRDKFAAMKELGMFLESVEFGGNFYGIYKGECTRAFEQGKPAVLVVEPEGLRQITAVASELGWSHYAVFVDIERDRQMQRFIDRTLQSYSGDEGAVSKAEFKSVLARIDIMVHKEANWREQTKEAIDLQIASFDEGNEGRVVKEIAYLATGDARFLSVKPQDFPAPA